MMLELDCTVGRQAAGRDGQYLDNFIHYSLIMTASISTVSN
jgi:hypothetical protein